MDRTFKHYLRWEEEVPNQKEMTLEEMGSEIVQIATNSQMTNQEIEDAQTKSSAYTSHKCLGSRKNNESERQIRTQVATVPEILSISSKETLPPSNSGLDVHRVLQQHSPVQNGTRSSKEKQSISIQSSVLSTTSTTLTKVSDVLDLLKFNLGDQNPQRKLKRAASGPLHSTSLSKQQRSCSPTGTTSLGNMETTWRNYSPPSLSQSILDCSSMTKQSDIKSDKAKTFYLPTEQSSPDITKPSSPQTVLELKDRVKEIKEVRKRAESLERNLTSAIDSMEQTGAALQQKSADTNTSAKSASRVDMEKWTAKSMRESEELGRRPRYLRHNIFRDDNLMSRSCAEWTETARPLPSVPDAEFNNILACQTIDHHPGLFTVDTPINVDEFEGLLTRHPNRPFVNSVLKGFRSGFWPWADTHIGEYPDTLDQSLKDPREEKEFRSEERRVGKEC